MSIEKNIINILVLVGMLSFNFANAYDLVVSGEFPIYDDPIIEECVNEVNTDSLTNYVNELVNYGTRFTYAINRRDVAEGIVDKYNSFGYENAVIDSFYSNSSYAIHGNWLYNVIVTLEGSCTDSEVIVISAYDSVVEENMSISQISYTNAPGADDNATGVASTMELARIIKAKNFIPRNTIKFVHVTGGITYWVGAIDYALKLKNSGSKVNLILESNSLGWDYDSNSFSITSYKENGYILGTNGYTNLAENLTLDYTTLTPDITQEFSGISFSTYPLSNQNFFSPLSLTGNLDSISENYENGNPNFHSIGDLPELLNMNFCTEISKVNIATLIAHDFYPGRNDEFELLQPGDGNSILLNIGSPTITDFQEYKIYVGQESTNYTQEFTTTDTSLVIDELEEGIEYFIAVSVVNQANYESLKTEKSIITESTPQAVSNLSKTPAPDEVNLEWDFNEELDISNYKIYRKREDESNFSEIEIVNSDINFYSDNSLEELYYYSYVVTAIDIQNFESTFSDTVTSRLLTLNSGVLVIDCSPGNSAGTLEEPSEDQIIESYESILINLTEMDYLNITDRRVIEIEELGGYSSVLWHNHKLSFSSSFIKSINQIENYLDLGGNLLVNISKLEEVDSDFRKNYLALDSIEYNSPARISLAESLTEDYVDLKVDTAKAKENYENHYRKVTSLFSDTNAQSIYRWCSDYDSTTNYGSMNNSIVGVEFDNSSNSSKVFTLSLPLYFVEEDQARSFVSYVFGEFFGEDVGINEEPNKSILPNNITLSQNYPNPFNPTTTIDYSLPIGFQGKVKLQVFNSNGQLAMNLVNEIQESGFHSIKVNCQNLSTGIYYYKLVTPSNYISKKLILLK